MAQRRGDTRESVLTVALELFAQRGYEQAALREIAERLRLSKAAVYHHFASKEAILSALADEFCARLDPLLEWGAQQPSGVATRVELLERYDELLDGRSGRLVRCLRESSAALREVDPALRVRRRLGTLVELLADEPVAPTPAPARLRGRLAVLALHLGTEGASGPPEREAARAAARDLVSQRQTGAAHRG